MKGKLPGVLRLLAALGAALLILLVPISMLLLPVSRQLYNAQELGASVRHPPSWSPVETESKTEIRPTAVRKSPPWFKAAFQARSWMGHDDLGRSLLFRLLPGFLVSLVVGLSAAAISVIIGATWGVVAGYAGGRLDLVMMRIVDVLQGLPYILLVILLKVGLSRPLIAWFGGNSRTVDLVILVMAVSGVSWLTMARMVRTQVLSIRSLGFVEAAKACGAGPFHILRRHVLPNLTGTIIVYATLVVPQAILQESFLSFLGIGIQQPTPSLGRLAADGVQAVNTFVGYWWLLVFPCGLLVLTLLTLNVLGDWLLDRLDPRLGSVSPP